MTVSDQYALLNNITSIGY